MCSHPSCNFQKSPALQKSSPLTAFEEKTRTREFTHAKVQGYATQVRLMMSSTVFLLILTITPSTRISTCCAAKSKLIPPTPASSSPSGAWGLRPRRTGRALALSRSPCPRNHHSVCLIAVTQTRRSNHWLPCGRGSKIELTPKRLKCAVVVRTQVGVVNEIHGHAIQQKLEV